MKPKPKERIVLLKPYSPGKPIEEVKRELGLKSVIKMASNENPLGPSPLGLRAAENALKKINLYPDGGSYYLKNKIAPELGVKPENLCFANGSNELILLSIHAFASDPGDEIAYGFPSFLIYRLIAQSYGIKVIETGLKNFTIDLEKLAGAVTEDTKIIFLCNPNNPVGTMNTADEVETFLERIPPHVLVVMDEAYYEYADKKIFPDSVSYLRDKKNLLILRTFSKMYGLAGLRIGYAIGDESIISVLDKTRQPFNVNSVAQAAALAAFDDKQHVERSLKENKNGIAFIMGRLKQMNIEYVSTSTNFLLIKTGNSKKIFDRFLQKGIIVRPMDAYGLGQYIRVTIGLPEHNEIFVEELKNILFSL
ncbi:MAG: histidinol-phosphate transaminase [Candidatus Aureabacteria bacterium]|nr:histidinol-phosphate transaminase [Candidatus Auribacterota bacterium]